MPVGLGSGLGFVDLVVTGGGGNGGNGGTLASGAGSSNIAAEYLLREGSGTVAHDTSGNGHDGTVTFSGSSSWITDGVHIGSGSDYILLPDATLANDNTSITSVSLEAWVSADSSSGTGYVIDLADGDLFLNQRGAIYGASAYSTSARITDASDDSTPAATSAWHQIVFVLDAVNNQTFMYVDGAQDFSGVLDYQNTPIGLSSSYGKKALGGDVPDGDSSFIGKIGEIRIYSGVLSPTAISQNFNARRSAYGL